MKTVSFVLSTFWAVAQNTPAILRHLPAALALIGKIRTVFGSETVQDLLKALNAFIDRIAPPAPTTNSTGTIQANPRQERRRRIFRFRNRLEVAGMMTDEETQQLCDQHHIGDNINDYQYA